MLGRLLPPFLGSQVFCEMVLCFAFLPPTTAIDDGSSLLTITNLQPETPSRTAVLVICCQVLPEFWGNSFFVTHCRGSFLVGAEAFDSQSRWCLRGSGEHRCLGAVGLLI